MVNEQGRKQVCYSVCTLYNFWRIRFSLHTFSRPPFFVCSPSAFFLNPNRQILRFLCFPTSASVQRTMCNLGFFKI
ncbi:hypothetical protein LINGRAHAP2_LOCUS16437 [Linum grandiflorum]